MRKNIGALFVISTLVILVLCSACVFSPLADQKPPKDSGSTQVTVPVESSRISFEEALQNLKKYQVDSSTGSENVKRLYYILAKDVDESGNAMSWVFGVNYGSGYRVLIYEKSGWTAFPRSNTTLPSEEILIDHIISPDNLFAQNKEVILSSSSSALTDMRELELQQGNYTLTLYSGNKGKVLSFNATTGAVIA